MPRPQRLFFCAALFAALVFASACTLKSEVGGGSSPYRGGQELFKPLAQSGAFKLSAGEAKNLALKMNASGQGMRSWRDMDFAVGQSLAHASARQTGQNALSMPGLTLSYGRLAQSLSHLRAVLPKLDSDPSILARDFDWYRIGPDYTFTGYYEPTLRASRVRTAEYSYPLYRVPPDLKKGKAYHTRNAIDRKGALAGRGLEIAWVNSETDAFFLHIQGSGRMLFTDGSISHILYAGKNNRAYVPIGRVMRDRGMLAPDNVNMQSIRACLLDNPAKCAEIFDTNPSYVFFREAKKGPVGAMGRPLTPYVSIATDRSVLPLGGLVFTTLPLPDANGDFRRAFYGLTLPQDTGGAIKGQRIDLFCGAGDEAAHIAGYLNVKGAVYVLVKK